MTQISSTEAALVRLLESCDFPNTTIQTCPHDWDDGFVQRLLTATPALLVAFHGADEPDGEKLTELNLDGRWSVFVVVGWNGKDQTARRLGTAGGYDLLHRAAAALHHAVLADENGERLPIVGVDGIGVEADSSTDLANLWIASIALTIELPLELVEGDACYGPLDAFLSWRGGIDIEGGKPRPATAEVAFTDADLPAGGHLEQ